MDQGRKDQGKHVWKLCFIDTLVKCGLAHNVASDMYEDMKADIDHVGDPADAAKDELSRWQD